LVYKNAGHRKTINAYVKKRNMFCGMESSIIAVYLVEDWLYCRNGQSKRVAWSDILSMEDQLLSFEEIGTWERALRVPGYGMELG
jgi:hypothetical protein